MCTIHKSECERCAHMVKQPCIFLKFHWDFSGDLKAQELIIEEAWLLINAAAPAMTATVCLLLPALGGPFAWSRAQMRSMELDTAIVTNSTEKLQPAGKCQQLWESIFFRNIATGAWTNSEAPTVLTVQRQKKTFLPQNFCLNGPPALSNWGRIRLAHSDCRLVSA